MKDRIASIVFAVMFPIGIILATFSWPEKYHAYMKAASLVILGSAIVLCIIMMVKARK